MKTEYDTDSPDNQVSEGKDGEQISEEKVDETQEEMNRELRARNFLLLYTFRMK